MRTFRHWTLAALVAAIALTAGAAMPEAQPEQPRQPRPQQPGQPGQPGRPGGPGGDRQIQSVGGGMRALNRGVRVLEATIADPAKKEESLAAVWMMQRGCLGAKASKPDDLEGDPEKILNQFRHGQIKLMGILLELETAVLDGKSDAAKELLAKAKAHRDASHKALGVKEEEGGGGEGGGGGGGGGGGR